MVETNDSTSIFKLRLAQAKAALQRKDYRAAAAELHAVLSADITCRPAWELMYEISGKKKPFEDFCREAAGKFYPTQVTKIEEMFQPNPAVSEPVQLMPVIENCQAAQRELQPPKPELMDSPPPFCESCGELLPGGSNFCPFCGALIEKAQPASPEFQDSVDSKILKNDFKPSANLDQAISTDPSHFLVVHPESNSDSFDEPGNDVKPELYEFAERPVPWSYTSTIKPTLPPQSPTPPSQPAYLPHPPALADPIEEELSIPRSHRKADFDTIKESAFALGNSGSLIVPIIVVGEVVLKFVIDFAGNYHGDFLPGLLLAFVGVALVCFLIPFVGQLVVVILRLLLIVSNLFGRVFGIGLGFICGMMYYLTLWAPPAVSYIASTVTGGIAGYILANIFTSIGNTEALSTPGAWSFIHYLALVASGAAGGWYFISVAIKEENGEFSEGFTGVNSALRKPANLLVKMTNSTESISQAGERILH